MSKNAADNLAVMDIKAQNIRLILGCLRFAEQKTKREMSDETGLSFATVSNLCRELTAAGILSEAEEAQGGEAPKAGRSPRPLKMEPDRLLGVCLDMHNQEDVVLAIANLRNDILVKKSVDFKSHTNLQDFITGCKAVCDAALAEIGAGYDRIAGGSAAVSAIFDQETGLTVGSGIALIESMPFKAMMEQAFGFPFFIDNEANISSASISLKHAKDAKNLIYILMSEGVGVGIITSGTQLSGSRGYAAEVCCMPIGSERLTCKLCGSVRCLESDLSISGFITKYLNYQKWDANDVSTLWRRFTEAVFKGDKHAIAVLNENAGILGRLSSVLVNLFDPEVIYYGGDAAVLFDQMQPTVRREIDLRRGGISETNVLLMSDTDADTILYGCAEIIYNRVNFNSIKP